MANQQLVDYIKSQLTAGVTKPDLQKAITTAGWSDQDSVEAFNVVEGKVPATPAAPVAPAISKPAAPVQPVTQPVTQPVAQPVQQPIKPVQPVMPTQQPVANPTGPISTIAPNLGGPMRASTMQMNVERGGPRSRTALWATAIVLVFIIVIGAAAYLFMPQIQEILGFYLGGQTPAPAIEETQLPPVTEPVATTTATSTATSTTSGTVASSTASTTLGQ
jgi:hypothetical protein